MAPDDRACAACHGPHCLSARDIWGTSSPDGFWRAGSLCPTLQGGSGDHLSPSLLPTPQSSPLLYTVLSALDQQRALPAHQDDTEGQDGICGRGLGRSWTHCPVERWCNFSRRWLALCPAFPEE